MGSSKEKATLKEGSPDRLDSGVVRVFPGNASATAFSKVYRIKGVTRSIVVDALKVLDDMWVDCQDSPNLIENYYLLRHYLSYLKRFCEGGV